MRCVINEWCMFAIAALVFSGCHVSVDDPGRIGYAACDTTAQCGYLSETCYDTGGIGICSLLCVDDFDCPSRNGFAGTCRTIAAYPRTQPICFQSCYRDLDCQTNTVCESNVCVPLLQSGGGLPNYERCTDTAQCDVAFSDVCAATDAQNRGMCTSGCQFDSDCLPRGNVPGVCRTATAVTGMPAICFLSCATGTACPTGTACNGDVCVPNT